MNIRVNFSLKEYNTFHIDVSAKQFVEVSTEQEAFEYLKHHHDPTEKFLILGGGSNILFVDDFEGTILHTKMKGIVLTPLNDSATLVEAAAGEEWDDLVEYCVNNNLGGIENLSLIPGCVGAAPIQNIGAYGVELADVFHSLDAINITTGSKQVFTKVDCRFGYRDSIFKNELKEKYLITKVRLKLSNYPKLNTSYKVLNEFLLIRNITPTLGNVATAVKEIRRSKLPDPVLLGNAGSFFKNPVILKENYLNLCKAYNNVPSFPIDETTVKIPAAWLIEQAGLKGKRIGNVGTHIKQPLVIVNYGGASGNEAIELMELIHKTVQNKFGILLENEVNIIK